MELHHPCALGPRAAGLEAERFHPSVRALVERLSEGIRETERLLEERFPDFRRLFGIDCHSQHLRGHLERDVKAAEAVVRKLRDKTVAVEFPDWQRWTRDELERRRWCQEQFKQHQTGTRWAEHSFHEDGGAGGLTWFGAFFFRDEADAVLFKLTWG